MLFFGLLGMGLGWQGGMRRLHGFYDIQPAVRMILYGLILGSFLALAIDELIFLPSYVLAAEGGGGTGTWPGLLVSLIVANLTSLGVDLSIQDNDSLGDLDGLANLNGHGLDLQPDRTGLLNRAGVVDDL